MSGRRGCAQTTSRSTVMLPWVARGVWADLVRGLGQLPRGFGRHIRQVDQSPQGQAVRRTVRADADARGHRRTVHIGLSGAGRDPQSAVEAGGVARREELLRIRALAGATHLLGEREIEVQPAVGAGHVSVAAVAGAAGPRRCTGSSRAWCHLSRRSAREARRVSTQRRNASGPANESRRDPHHQTPITGTCTKAGLTRRSHRNGNAVNPLTGGLSHGHRSVHSRYG